MRMDRQWWFLAFGLVLARVGRVSCSGKRHEPRTRYSIVPRILLADACRDSRKHQMLNFTSSIHTHVDGDLVDFDFYNKQEARIFNQFVIKVWDCKEAITFNNCEYWNTWRWSVGICELLRAKNMMWSPFVEGTHPRFGCPFRVGWRSGRNVTLDYRLVAEQLSKTMGAEKVFMVDYELYDQDGNLSICGKFNVKMLLVNKRKG